MKSARFALAVALCALSFSLVALAQSRQHKSAVADHAAARARSLENLREMDPLNAKLLDWDKQYTLTAPPRMGPLFATQVSVDPRMSKLPRSPLTVLFPHMGYAACAALILSLLGVLLSFDAISADRHGGPIRLFLSGGVSKAQILLGKAAARVGLASAAFVISALLGAVVAWPGGTARFGLQEWSVLGGFAIAGVLYITVFVLVGLLVSVACRSTETSLVVGLAVWVVSAVSLPALIPAVTGTISPPASSWDLNQALRRQALAGVTASREASRRCDEIDCEGSLWAWFANDSSGYLAALEDASDSVAILVQSHTSSAIQRVRLGLAASRMTPYTCMVCLGHGLTGTGTEDFVAHTYQMASYRRAWFAAWANVFRKSQTARGDLSGDLPLFQYHPRAVTARLEDAATDAALLCAWAVLLFLVTYGLWSRRDETAHT